MHVRNGIVRFYGRVSGASTPFITLASFSGCSTASCISLYSTPKVPLRSIFIGEMAVISVSIEVYSMADFDANHVVVMDDYYFMQAANGVHVRLVLVSVVRALLRNKG